MMKHTIRIVLLLTVVLLATMPAQAGKKKISKAELHDKIAASWIGQMIGNIYGLPHENKYINAPGAETWPYGYTKNLDKLEKYGGAFSDDDTDVEYMYLLQMEKWGPEPTYAQLKDAWMYHIRDRVWLANRAALGLMHYGYTPPFTGSKALNPHWYQIDPQLINEIWAVTAPGMVQYAARKSAWAARITSDDWGADPTIHYGAMYSAAFFEQDIRKLIDIGLAALPQGSRYAVTVKEMIELHAKYPDWKEAWKIMAQKYYVDEPDMTKTIWNANLNGACAILAMLYGEGDFQHTLDLSCAMGFDADNQAATVAGLLGVMYGMKGLPENLYLPVEGWTKPFNDTYINITRYDMPDATISSMIDRTVEAAVKLILAKGGKLSGSEGNETITINSSATFEAPMEFYIGPLPELNVNQAIDFEFYTEDNSIYNWSLAEGKLPPGLTFSKGKLSGTPVLAGYFPVVLQMDNGKSFIKHNFDLLVRPENIAMQADTIYANVSKLNEAVLDSCWFTFGKSLYAKDVSVINDGITSGAASVFYSLAAKAKLPKVDYYGYGWNHEVEPAMIIFNTGGMEEFGGWFSSLSVQYLDPAGRWVNAENVRLQPGLPASGEVFIQPHNAQYLITFDKVKTKGIRIIGDAAIQSHWHKYTKNVSGFTSITELSVYP